MLIKKLIFKPFKKCYHIIRFKNTIPLSLFGFAKRCKPHKNLGKGKRPFAGSLPESTSKA